LEAGISKNPEIYFLRAVPRFIPRVSLLPDGSAKGMPMAPLGGKTVTRLAADGGGAIDKTPTGL